MSNGNVGSQQEAVSLDRAIAYATEMQSSNEQGANSADQTLARLQAGGVTGRPLQVLSQAKEGFTLQAQRFAEMRSALEEQKALQERYRANPDAGGKEFLLQE